MGPLPLPSSPLHDNLLDDKAASCDLYCMRTTHNKMHYTRVPDERPEAVIFPEMAVPGTGKTNSFRNSGYQWKQGLAPPRSFCNTTTQWVSLNIENAAMPI